jgi:hypothetical protein
MVLEPLGKIYKIGTVPGNPYDQVAVLFRVFLGIEEHFPAYHVELDMRDSKIGP